MAKRNTFSNALAAANKRLSRALEERDHAVRTLAALDVEIPSLQHTIAALEKQLGVPQKADIGPPSIPAPSRSVVSDAPVAIPPELAKYVGPQDLSGMGSVPAQSGTPQKELSEDELLDAGDIK